MRHISYILFYFILATFQKNAKAQTPTIGLIQYTEAAQEGYTLISPSGKTTYLIDNCGQEINQWTSEYNLSGRAHLTEAGLLLRSGRDDNSTITVGGEAGILELFDWDGNVVWEYFYSGSDFISHHDITPMPNGNILILAVEVISENEAISLGRQSDLVQEELYIETVVEIKPIGTNQAEIVWKWSVLDHIIQDVSELIPSFGIIADHPELINFNFTSNGFSADWLHLNGLDYNPVLDQIAFSSRTTDEFYVIDHSTTTDEAASHTGGNSSKGGDFLYRWGNPRAYDRGTIEDRKLYGPHDINWIDEGFPNAGEFMVFNNGNGRPAGQYSTADRIVPPINSDGLYELASETNYLPANTEIAFQAVPANSFFASNISGVEQLANGNYLVCHGPRGRLLEINSLGETVWEYINPVTNSGPKPQGTSFPLVGNSLFSVTRYLPSYSGLEGYDLTPGAVLETNPYASDCTLSSTSQSMDSSGDFLLYPNPVTSELQISHTESNNSRIQILDIHGRILLSNNFASPNPTLDLSHLPAGFYFVEIQDKDKAMVRRFVKN